jgi:two-component system sensor histidine kinase MprB
MSLRVKLVLSIVLLTTAATLAIGLFSYVGTADRLLTEVDRSLQTGAEASEHGGRGLEDQVLGPFNGGSDDLIRGYGQGPIQTIDTNGNVRSTSIGVLLPVDDLDRVVAAGHELSVRRTIAIDGVDYRMLTRSLDNGSGAVQVARSMAETERVLDALRNFILVAAAIVIAAAALAGWFIARQVTRRLVRLTGVAEQVTSTGRLDIPVPVEGNDEAGRLGKAFNEMLGALGRSKDDQQRLVQDAGHELRTPLTSLSTNVSVLRRHPDLDPATQARVLDDLNLETRELTALVNELVELATDRRTDEDLEPVDLGELVERVAERARRRTGRIVNVLIDPATVTVVTGRPLALERAVSNLIDNAAKFDPDGVEPITASVRSGRVTVCDRGPGISDADRPHVFDRFYRAVEARSRPGSGLGLSIVTDVATSHGGFAFAESRDGGGACVGFELPT